MRTASFTVELDLTVETCWVCGITWAMDKRWAHKRSERGECFYCPKGCKLSYGESENDKLRKQLEDEKTKLLREQQRHDQTRADRDAVGRKLIATKGVVTRIKNRVSNGVCPCCHRTFKNLKRHMSSKHPAFTTEELFED